MGTPHYSPVVGQGAAMKVQISDLASAPFPQPPPAPKSLNGEEKWVDNFYAKQFTSNPDDPPPYSPTMEEIALGDEVGQTNWLTVTSVFKKVF